MPAHPASALLCSCLCTSPPRVLGDCSLKEGALCSFLIIVLWGIDVKPPSVTACRRRISGWRRGGLEVWRVLSQGSPDRQFPHGERPPGQSFPVTIEPVPRPGWKMALLEEMGLSVLIWGAYCWVEDGGSPGMSLSTNYEALHSGAGGGKAEKCIYDLSSWKLVCRGSSEWGKWQMVSVHLFIIRPHALISYDCVVFASILIVLVTCRMEKPFSPPK